MHIILTRLIWYDDIDDIHGIDDIDDVHDIDGDEIHNIPWYG